ncbi:RING finger protein [Aspergillus affinis]|uniref:RING finger protein n=1 Tax=Aspergillus affinis TaxID=1070780 RepID=UPI0022FEB518|nr:uncharacterized protein KD926_008971 [Aspergillus affinis]KAI9039870.1 hypothetical protein KD926_008971 [Aspergillus affinis]
MLLNSSFQLDDLGSTKACNTSEIPAVGPQGRHARRRLWLYDQAAQDRSSAAKSLTGIHLNERRGRRVPEPCKRFGEWSFVPTMAASIVRPFVSMSVEPLDRPGDTRGFPIEIDIDDESADHEHHSGNPRPGDSRAHPIDLDQEDENSNQGESGHCHCQCRERSLSIDNTVYDFTCKICYESRVDIVLECGHTFCYACVNRFFQDSALKAVKDDLFDAYMLLSGNAFCLAWKMLEGSSKTLSPNSEICYYHSPVPNLEHYCRENHIVLAHLPHIVYDNQQDPNGQAMQVAQATIDSYNQELNRQNISFGYDSGLRTVKPSEFLPICLEEPPVYTPTYKTNDGDQCWQTLFSLLDMPIQKWYKDCVALETSPDHQEIIKITKQIRDELTSAVLPAYGLGETLIPDSNPRVEELLKELTDLAKSERERNWDLYKSVGEDYKSDLTRHGGDEQVQVIISRSNLAKILSSRDGEQLIVDSLLGPGHEHLRHLRLKDALTTFSGGPQLQQFLQQLLQLLQLLQSFPQLFPQSFPQQFPYQSPQQFPQPFHQQLPQQFPQPFPQPFNQQPQQVPQQLSPQFPQQFSPHKLGQ